MHLDVDRAHRPLLQDQARDELLKGVRLDPYIAHSDLARERNLQLLGRQLEIVLQIGADLADYELFQH